MKKESFFKTQKLFFLTALIISLVFFDQFSKYLIEANFNLYESTKIIPFLNFTFIKNFGGAFNLFNDASLNLGLIFILLVSNMFLSSLGNFYQSCIQRNPFQRKGFLEPNSCWWLGKSF